MEENINIGERLVDHFSEAKKSASVDPSIEEWLRSSPENRKAYNSYKKIWKGITRLSNAKQFKPVQAWQKVNDQLIRTVGINRQVRRLKYATIGMAASLLLLLGFTFYTSLFSLSSGKTEVVSAYGSRSELILPDGSMVKLNAGSKLSYSYNQITKQREVFFQGEGFFEVAKDNHPFVIYSADMKLKVLGTRFNLRAYPEDSEIKTTLIEGKVELENDCGNKLFMKPGQVVSFHKESKQMSFLKEDPSHLCGWMENKLYMDNMSLTEVCAMLERNYDVQITMLPVDFGKNIHYTGVLQEETVITILDALCELSVIKYQIKGKEIIITKK